MGEDEEEEEDGGEVEDEGEEGEEEEGMDDKECQKGWFGHGTMCSHEYTITHHGCEFGWFGHGNKCYKLSSKNKKFGKAKEAAAKKGGQLAIIKDQDKLDALVQAFGLDDPDHEAWIEGKLDSDSTVGNVDWVDGETSDVDGGNAPDLWAEDEPTGLGKGKGKFCVNIKMGKWHDQKCSNKNKFIIEM